MPARKKYPHHPGSKGDVETGREGADYYAPQVGRRQRQVLEALRQGPGSAEEISERIDLHWYLVRPRVSELKALGLAVDDGSRGKGALGGKVHRVRASTPEEHAAFLATQAAEAEHV